MGRVSFSGARTGKRKGNRSLGNFMERLDFEIGETKRIIFPVLIDKDGEKGLVILAEPYHPVKQGFLQFISSRGKPFGSHKVRCMHPYSQTDRRVAKRSAERQEMCPFCELANFERRQLYTEMEERFGKEGFKELTKAEQKEFYQEMDAVSQVEESYYKKEDDDGNNFTVNRLDMTVLAFEIETEEVVNGNGKKVARVVRDEEGFPKYKKILMGMSQARLDKFKNAADNAFEQETLNHETHAYGFTEGEGEEAEDVLVGFVDFAVKFPQKPDKMASAKDMTPFALPSAKSIITKEFVEKVQAESESLIEEAEKAFKVLNPALKSITPTEAIGLMVDNGEYYQGMKEKFGTAEDEEFYAEVYRKVLGSGGNEEEEDGQEEGQEGQEEVNETSQQTQTSQTQTSQTQAGTQAGTQTQQADEQTPADTGKAEEDVDFDEFMEA